jgi:hypothetical protein
MNPNKGNEKGKIENLCKLVERRFLCKVKNVKNLQEAQNILIERLNKYNCAHKLKGNTKTIDDLFFGRKKIFERK